MTSLIAHMAMAIFHDGVRPIVPELLAGRMKRKEVGNIAFGLSIGFVASVGVSFTLTTGLLNPWLLFLPTDIIGIMSPKKWISFILGSLWGIIIVTCSEFFNVVLSSLPVNVMGAFGELGTVVLTVFALFPILAIFYQYGWKKGLVSGIIVLIARLLVIKYTRFYPESVEILIGMIILIGTAIFNDLKNRVPNESEDIMDVMYEQGNKRLLKNLPFLGVVGALIAVVTNLHFLAGSEVSIFSLSTAYKMTDLVAQKQLIHQTALSEFMRGLGFIPLLATTALTTGIFDIIGFTFVFVVGYLAPSPLVAGILGFVLTCVEVLLLRKIVKQLTKFPSIRNASDNIRNAMNNLMEFSLLIGGIFAVIKMGGYTGFTIMVILYYLNESMGRPVLKVAAPAVAAILTGIILNIANLLGLFAI